VWVPFRRFVKFMFRIGSSYVVVFRVCVVLAIVNVMLASFVSVTVTFMNKEVSVVFVLRAGVGVV